MDLRVHTAGDERHHQQRRESRHGAGPTPRASQTPPAAAGRQSAFDAPPDFAAVLLAAHRNGQSIHHVEHALQGGVMRPAVVALVEVLLRGEGVDLLAVVMQDQLFFAQMVHHLFHDRAALTTGSRPRRNFCTARNTLCLAAPGWHPSTRLTSSIHMPSKWRNTKADLSVALRSPMAAVSRSRTSPLSAMRSGLGSGEGTVITGLSRSWPPSGASA